MRVSTTRPSIVMPFVCGIADRASTSVANVTNANPLHDNCLSRSGTTSHAVTRPNFSKIGRNCSFVTCGGKFATYSLFLSSGLLPPPLNGAAPACGAPAPTPTDDAGAALAPAPKPEILAFKGLY